MKCQIRKKEHPEIKSKLHPRSKHRNRYDFDQLAKSVPELSKFVSRNKYGDESIDFFDPKAVSMLNKALMKHHYQIENWEVPKNYLSPPIPGRADYLHYLADLLANNNKGKIPRGKKIRCLDVGVGASCIYPLIGCREFEWDFIGVDIDQAALASAENIIKQNPTLKSKIDLRIQNDTNQIFKGVVKSKERLDLVLCNPPFHTSMEEVQKVNKRKLSNLKRKKITKAILNFGGTNNELWCAGGEKGFVGRMIEQSREIADNCLWFTSLVSKEDHLRPLYSSLKKIQAAEVVTIPMGQGNKTSRLIAWTFKNPLQQAMWAKDRWK